MVNWVVYNSLEIGLSALGNRPKRCVVLFIYIDSWVVSSHTVGLLYRKNLFLLVLPFDIVVFLPILSFSPSNLQISRPRLSQLIRWESILRLRIGKFGKRPTAELWTWWIGRVNHEEIAYLGQTYLNEDLSKLFGCLLVSSFPLIWTFSVASAFTEQYVNL